MRRGRPGNWRWRRTAPLRAVLLSAAVAAVAGGQPGQDEGEDGDDGEEAARTRLHLVTFMNRPDRKFTFLQVSAQAYSLYPQVIGYGLDAWWPDGLGIKINALRHYVREHVEGNDIVVFADAFDVLVFATEAEIIARFEEKEMAVNRSLIFNAEQVCFPNYGGVCDDYPKAPHRWRFLNSGLIAGRGYAFKRMLRNPVQNIIRYGDQYWYQRYFREHPSEVALDTTCTLLCALWGMGVEADLEDRRVLVKDVGTAPAFVHFVSAGHWTYWQGGVATSTLQDTFRRLYPSEAAALLEPWFVGAHLGTLEVEVYRGVGWWATMRGVLCLKCNLLGSTEGECHWFRGFFSEHCFGNFVLLAFIVLLALVALGHRCRTGRRHPDSAPAMESTPSGSLAAAGRIRSVLLWVRKQVKSSAKRAELVM